MSVTAPLPSNATNRRALVAEDDAQMRALVADALRKEGFVVDEVEDGGRMLARAIPAAAEMAPRYDLLVSDVRMPIVDGLSLVERLRVHDARTPVILMTAFGDEATRTRAKRLGVTLFDKPFKLDELRAEARRLFEDSVRRGTTP